MILAIDPGTTESAYVYLKDGLIHESAKVANREMRDILKGVQPIDVVCEMVACYGAPVGAGVFETCLWIGRFQEAFGYDERFHRRTRVEVKMHLCHRAAKVTDGIIRQALIDRFGPGKDAAIGRKATPGPLYGIAGDVWAALALAVTFADQQAVVNRPA